MWTYRKTSLRIVLVSAVALIVGACADSAVQPAAEPAPEPAVAAPAPPTTTEPPPAESSVSKPEPEPVPAVEEEPVPETSQTTETAPPTDVEPAGPPARIGYRVVDVAADDVLNVRAGPSARDEIIGALQHDATGVVVTATWSDPWWEIWLDDRISGFVHSRYLEADPAWTAPFDRYPCAGDAEEPQALADSSEATNAQFVFGYDYLRSAECDRLVIRLGTLADPAAPEWGFPSIAADRVPAGIEVRTEANRVVVSLPEAIDVRWGATTGDFPGALLVVTAREWTETGQFLDAHLLYESDRVAHARFLDHPARIVVDVRPAPTASGTDLSPFVDGSFILTEPARWDGSIAGTHQPLTITGLGTAYESQAWMSLHRADGATGPIEARWSGGYNCTDGTFGPTARGDAYCTGTSGSSIWGGFAVTISGLDPGRYRFSMEGECMVDEVGEDVCEQQDLDYEFVVHDAAGTAAAALSPFFTEAYAFDQRLDMAARRFEWAFDPETATLDPAAAAEIRDLTTSPLAELVPAGLSPELERAVLAVYADLDSRASALEGAISRLTEYYELVAAVQCLENGTESEARFDADLRRARRLAAVEPAPAAAPDSIEAGVLATRLATITLINWGCESCGGMTYDEPLPVDWEGRTVGDGITFDASFDGERWRIGPHAC